MVDWGLALGGPGTCPVCIRQLSLTSNRASCDYYLVHSVYVGMKQAIESWQCWLDLWYLPCVHMLAIPHI